MVREIINESANIYLLFTNLICSTLRNLQFPSSKLKALDLLLLFGAKIDDEYILDRLVPYVLTMVEDENAMVRSSALKTLTSMVKSSIDI
jgi:phosphoinositide-3-kinase regulatory subunit 4